MRIVPLTTRPCPDIQVSGPVAQYVGGADATDGAIGADAPATRLRLRAEAGSPAPRARGGRGAIAHLEAKGFQNWTSASSSFCGAARKSAFGFCTDVRHVRGGSKERGHLEGSLDLQQLLEGIFERVKITGIRRAIGQDRF